MKKITHVTLIGLWILVASFFLKKLWSSAIEIEIIPRFPDAFWMVLDSFFNAHCCESADDVGINVTAAIAILIVSTLTWLGLRLCPQGKMVLQLRQALRVSLTGIWVLVAAWTLTHWWLNAVAARVFPRLPEAFWLALENSLNITGAWADALSVLTGFAMAILIVSLLTWLALWLWRRIKKR